MRTLRWLIPFTALLLGACQVSLAGDITPPPGSELQQVEVTAEPVVFPDAMPNPDHGALTFAQSCVPCHGESGLGDGPQSGQLPVAVTAIGDEELARANSPEAWFNMISQGNLDSFMPPFAQSLTIQQRWDVLAYVYSLSLEDEQLSEGRAMAQQLGLDLSSLETLAGRSQNELAVQLVSDLDLTAEEGQALVAYLHAGAMGIFAAPELVQLDAVTPEVDAPEEPPADEEAALAGGVTVSGQVTNGSGGALPAGAELLLRGFDASSEVFSRSTTMQVDGAYQFDDLDLSSDWVYAVTMEYEGLIYFSSAFEFDGEQTAYEFPLTIYETTDDTSDLVIERLQLIFDFADPGLVRVVQLVAISNLGDRAVAPLSDEEPVLLYELPEEALNLAFESGALGERYVPTESGFGDLRAVLPGSGEYQMLFAYELPYNRGLDFAQPTQLRVNAVSAFVPAGQVDLESAEFSLLGDQQLDSQVYTGYQRLASIEAGETLQFDLNGAHPLGGGNQLLSVLSQDEVLIGLVGLTIAVAGAWLWLRRLNATGPAPDEIMDAIIALDARYAEEQIGEDAYLQRRAALKDRLRQALSAQKSNAK